jgi:hypothetical protein
MTRLQLRHLQVYLKYRERPMTITGLLWTNRRIYLLMSVLFGAIAWIFYLLGGWWLAGYVIVALVCAVARDIGYYRRSARIWPVTKDVLDWPKIEGLVSGATEQKK